MQFKVEAATLTRKSMDKNSDYYSKLIWEGFFGVMFIVSNNLYKELVFEFGIRQLSSLVKVQNVEVGLCVRFANCRSRHHGTYYKWVTIGANT